MTFIIPLTSALYYKLNKALLILLFWVVYISVEWYEKQAYRVLVSLARDQLFTHVCIIPSELQLVYLGKTSHTHMKSFHANPT